MIACYVEGTGKIFRMSLCLMDEGTGMCSPDFLREIEPCFEEGYELKDGLPVLAPGEFIEYVEDWEYEVAAANSASWKHIEDEEDGSSEDMLLLNADEVQEPATLDHPELGFRWLFDCSAEEVHAA